jgi:hypothetical protein
LLWFCHDALLFDTTLALSPPYAVLRGAPGVHPAPG